MSVTIRRAFFGDEAVLAELNAFVHDFHLTNNPAYFKPAAPEDVAAWFGGLLEKPTARIWIAEWDGAAVGYVSTLLRERPENVFGRARQWLEIDQIGVRPDQRRKGIGRELVDAAIQAADAGGIRDIELSSWVFNSDAQEAFRKLGFRPSVVRLGRESSKR
jgi:ribosomal protein S18 acetylase RimI-like enzyme